MEYTKERGLCPKCGADMENWAEVFQGEIHYCPGMEREDKAKVLKVMTTLRKYGIPCFLPTDVLPDGLEDYIQGEG